MTKIKYIVTKLHPRLKAGYSIIKNNSAIIMFYETGYLKFDDETLQDWIYRRYIVKSTLIRQLDISISLNDIKQAICKVFNVNDTMIASKLRFPEIVYLKKMICYFGKIYSHNSMREIGMFIRTSINDDSAYDHSTVHYHHKKINERDGFDKKITNDIQAIKQELNLIKL